MVLNIYCDGEKGELLRKIFASPSYIGDCPRSGHLTFKPVVGITEYQEDAAEECRSSTISVTRGECARTRVVVERLCFCARQKLGRSQFAHNGHPSACAQTIGAGFNHRGGVGGGTNSAGSLDAGMITHHAAHQR